MEAVEKARHILRSVGALDTLIPGDVVQIGLIIVDQLIEEGILVDYWREVRTAMLEFIPEKEILSVEILKNEPFIKKYSQKNRAADIAIIRQYFIYWLVKNKHFTYERAGEVFNMNHSTCIYAVKTIGAAMHVRCKKTYKYIDEARSILRQNGYL